MPTSCPQAPRPGAGYVRRSLSHPRCGSSLLSPCWSLASMTAAAWSPGLKQQLPLKVQPAQSPPSTAPWACGVTIFSQGQPS